MGLLTYCCLFAPDSVGETEAVTAAGSFCAAVPFVVATAFTFFFDDVFEFVVECEWCDEEDDDVEPDMTEFVMGNSSSLILFNTIGYN